MEKLNESKAKVLANSLVGGAGKAHRAANFDNALPPLRLVLQRKSEDEALECVSDPRSVAELHAKPCRNTWKADAANFNEHFGVGFKKLRTDHLFEANETARLMDIDAVTGRGSLKFFPGSTAIGADDMKFQAMSELPDVALNQLGSLCGQAVANLSLPMQDRKSVV